MEDGLMKRNSILLLSFLGLILALFSPAKVAPIGALPRPDPRPSAQVQIYHYDFESGTND
jgi:hypothetical protein